MSLLSRPHYATEVYENLPRGHFVLKVDSRSRSAVRYEIAEGNEDSVFSVNPGSGILMTQRDLDFEERRFYNLTLEVANTAGKRSRCTVNVHVLDVNDNAPRFLSHSFSGHVSESASIGSLILVGENHSPLVIRATDADTGVNSLLFYQITDERARRYFTIDETTGAIRTVTSLDFETDQSFEFNVRVSDRGDPRLSSESMARVRIDVGDENDSPPKFDHAEYRTELLLPTYRNVAVVRVNASDPDAGVETELKYAIVGGNGENRFKIDPESGLISVADEEEVAASRQYSLDVAVTDGKHTDKTVVYVRVEKSDNSGLAFGSERYQVSFTHFVALYIFYWFPSY
jgi:protocadherin Fat 1/2/3